MNSARTQSAHHIGLTMPDLAAAQHVFEDALDATTIRHMMCRVPGNIRLARIGA